MNDDQGLALFDRSPGYSAEPVYPASVINLEAETALLGAILTDNRIMVEVADEVDADDFAENLHARLYQQMLVLIDRGASVSGATLAPYFARDKAMLDVGGTGFLAQLGMQSAGLIMARDLARQIADLAKRRRLIDECRANMVAAATFEGSTEELADSIDESLSRAMLRKGPAEGGTAAMVWDSALQAIDDEKAGLKARGCVVQGLEIVGEIGLKLRPGSFSVIGARPAMGKTAVGVKIAAGAAANGHGVLYISLEVPKDEIGLRIVADQLFDNGKSATFDQIQKGDFTAFDMQRLAARRKLVADWPLHVVAPKRLKIGRLAMTIRRFQRRLAMKGRTLELVVIDYLGLIKGDGSRGKYEEVSGITAELKAIALDTDVALLALAQLSRAVEQREDKRPQLSDLRDSGTIEQDADVVGFLYRDEYYLRKEEPPEGGEGTAAKKRAAWEERLAQASNRLLIYTAKVRGGKEGRKNCYFFLDAQAVRPPSFYQDQFGYGDRE